MDLWGPGFSDSRDPIFSDSGDPISLILGTRFSLILGTRFEILGTRIGSLKHLKNPGLIVMRHFLCGVQRVKNFMNLHLHCIVSNLEKISKMSAFHP